MRCWDFLRKEGGIGGESLFILVISIIIIAVWQWVQYLVSDWLQLYIHCLCFQAHILQLLYNMYTMNFSAKIRHVSPRFQWICIFWTRYILKKILIWTDRKFRECCWDIEQTGSVGETILHLCLLNATAIHADLAKRLIQAYPKMINDIYLADEYFGKKTFTVYDNCISIVNKQK